MADYPFEYYCSYGGDLVIATESDMLDSVANQVSGYGEATIYAVQVRWQGACDRAPAIEARALAYAMHRTSRPDARRALAREYVRKVAQCVAEMYGLAEPDSPVGLFRASEVGPM